MDINAGIVDQHLTGLVEKNPGWFAGMDADRSRSTAFVLLCMAHYLHVSLEDSQALLTDGGNDAGVDGLDMAEVENNEFLVTIFQGKYRRNLDGAANFPANEVKKIISTVRVLFDPQREIVLNKQLMPKIEEIRSLVVEGYVPQVKVVLCNNGTIWSQDAQGSIEQLLKDMPNQVEFIHFNHASIVKILQRKKTVDEKIQLKGNMVVDSMDRMRVLVGRVSAETIADLFDDHGDHLLQGNIRRYLGTHASPVNEQIRDTLQSNSGHFYFYNNGITIVCDRFDYNAGQQSDHKIGVKNMQIINGGQTCKTIHKTLAEAQDGLAQDASVMVRIYELPSDHTQEFVNAITQATNSQNPVHLRDLKSNDELQQRLEVDVQGLGYTYKRFRYEGVNGSPEAITSLSVAEATMAVWRGQPHRAKFQRRQHFGKMYNAIFKSLNAAQAILAVLVFKMVESERKRAVPDKSPDFLPYASHYIAMLMGRCLLRNQGCALADVSHRTFQSLLEDFNANKSKYYKEAVAAIDAAIKQCYGKRQISLQQLSATFRRGDLLEMLPG